MLWRCGFFLQKHLRWLRLNSLITTIATRDQIPVQNIFYKLNTSIIFIQIQTPWQRSNETSLALGADKHLIEACALSWATVRTICLSLHLPRFLSSHQHGLSTLLSFHKHGFCTHVPIKQDPETTGQSEPRDKEDGEGPRSEITGHMERHWGHWDRKAEQRARVGWKDGNCILPPVREMLYSLVVNVQTDPVDEKDREEKGKGGAVWLCLIALKYRGHALISVKQTFPAHIL